MKNTLDTSQCDSEPIRFINSIQNFGAILVVDENNKIKCVSENLAEYTTGSEHKILDQSYSPEMIDTDRFYMSETKVGSLNIIQIEKRTSESAGNLNNYLNTLQNSETLKNLLESSAKIIAEISDFDRVMIYKFHEDFHGEVVAENVKPGVQSYYGLHYPASDIPTPARAIFLENWIRMIPDVSYEAVAIQSTLPDVVDLGQVLLRAVSPIHIQYLNNMNVGATLTISIIVNNKLWGLFACHNLAAKMVSKNLRDKCETIGRFTSSLINVVSLKERTHHVEKIRQIHSNLNMRLEKTEDMAQELSANSPTLLDLIDAKGASAALYVDGYWAHIGETPSEDQLNKLVEWLSVHHNSHLYFCTHELSTHFPEAIEYKEVCSGLLALAIPKTNKNFIFWFRPEVIQNVVWAGNPDKSINQQDGRLSPRASFQEWTRTVTAKSLPWFSWEIDAALELRNLILAADLKKQFGKEHKARNEAERATAMREELMAVVSHDLKNPLNSIQMNTQLLKRAVGENPKTAVLVDRVLRSTVTMNNLVNDILSIAKLESGQFEVQKVQTPIRLAIQESIEMLMPLALDKGIKLIEAKTELNCEVYYDYDRMLQVLSNLIGNAIKFTPENGAVTVEIEKCGPTFVKIRITDTGPGIHKDHLFDVFDRFWQANQTKRLGTGLGLSIAKGIVLAHGGEIWVESNNGIGSSFQFTLPL